MTGPPNPSPGSEERRAGVGWERSTWKTDRKTLFLRARTRDDVAVMTALDPSRTVALVAKPVLMGESRC